MLTPRALAAFGFVSLGALGAIVPWLGDRLLAAGMSPSDLGLLMAMLPVGRLIGAPIWGWAADRFRAAGILLRLGCAAALLGVALLLAADTAAEAEAAVLLFSLGRVPLGPLWDAAVLDALARHPDGPAAYGRIRLWGSVGFAGAVVLSARFADPLHLCAALSAATLLLSLGFPARGEGGPAPVLPALRALSGAPGFWPVLAWSAAQALTVSVYDTFYSVHVRALYADLNAAAWVLPASVALGVAVEIAVMRASAPLLARLGVRRAMILASASGLLRWPLTALAPSPLLLVLTQSLHGTTFALFWLAGVQWFVRRSPLEISASAQSLYAAASYGLGALLGALLAGRLQTCGSAAIFWGMTAVSAVATLLAWQAGSGDGAGEKSAADVTGSSRQNPPAASRT